MDKLRQILDDDLEAIEIGAAILGTGGGGNPYVGKLRCRQELRKGNVINVIPLDELPDDALVMSLGSIGAPVVGSEKLKQGEECLRALRAMEDYLDCKIDALISAEIGGSNALEPMITAAQAGIPIVDGDGMGRAFPEMQMCTWSIYGHEVAPSTMSDEKGNVVIFKETRTAVWLETLARATVVAMGASAGLAMAPMRGAFVKKVAIPNTVSQARLLGQAVQEAHRKNIDPVQMVLTQEDGQLLMTGKIIDVQRHLKGGFAVGHINIDGFGKFHGQAGRIDIQNEFLIFARDDKIEVCVPDLIVVLDVDTGLPIITEALRYGQRIAVLALPCHDLLRTPEALEVVGPSAFGYTDISFSPMGAAGAEGLDHA